MSRPRKGGDISAIFIHAGAGYHSIHNEKSHLEACENAAKAAMAMLKSGGSAVDAVEIAIIVLEDTEITNSGYGSNLTMEGKVECDASIVDHEGRSGAAGAVAHVKNPISLARVILDASAYPMTLHRVPPNFLVGSGATDFAYENHLPVLPHDAMIGEGAKQRWQRWLNELKYAEAMARRSIGDQHSASQRSRFIRHPAQSLPAQLLATPHKVAQEPTQSTIDVAHQSGHIQTRTGDNTTTQTSRVQAQMGNVQGDQLPDTPRSAMDVDPVSGTSAQDARSRGSATSGTDHVSDTVGAIAIDNYGNIAAGSSSGGIGMKHTGRIGPAALVGIGTAVVPMDPNDPEQAQVATVTSGTGEHIATTMAANTCALRMYYNQRKGPDGLFEDVTEDEAMRGMIMNDFLEHPGVKRSHCEGAIGILSVKKTVDGIFLYFGHNTESFAIASMNSDDRKPVSVMSRNSKGQGNIAQGGRVSRRKRYKVSDSTAEASAQWYVYYKFCSHGKERFGLL